MTQLRPTCKKCIYWVAETATQPTKVGHCHRYPPVVAIHPTAGTTIQKFPSTDQHHWCGEWDGDPDRFSGALRKLLERRPADAQP